MLLAAGYEAETVAKADRDLKDALGPLAYVVSGGTASDAAVCIPLCNEGFHMGPAA